MSVPSDDPPRNNPFADLSLDEGRLAVELRPPRSGLSYGESVDRWIDLRHGVRGLARRGFPILFTDDAVGASEEESLLHLTANLGPDAPFPLLVPFLTAKHPLEYCLRFADRARSSGIRAVTVVGGDVSVGPPRCLPRSKDLRAVIRERVPGLALGGWANPGRDPRGQAGFVAEPDFAADYVLTQIVSHHDPAPIEEFLETLDRAGVGVPVVFGVFHYRSANPTTLETLSRFFPVPASALAREFEEGASPDDVCARTIRAIHRAGGSRVYLSNLDPAGVVRRVEAILGRI